MKIMCWDHCTECNMSQNRFWVESKEQFDKEKADTLGHTCQFCGGKLISYTDQALPSET